MQVEKNLPNNNNSNNNNNNNIDDNNNNNNKKQRKGLKGSSFIENIEVCWTEHLYGFLLSISYF